MRHPADSDALPALLEQIRATADAPGEHTRRMQAEKVTDQFTDALRRFAGELAEQQNVSIDIHIGSERSR